MSAVVSGVTIQGNITPEATLGGEIAPYIVRAQPKTAVPTTSQQIILPDDGYDYLSQVTVSAIPAPKMQLKAVTPTAYEQTVGPDDGYDGLSRVTVSAISYTEEPNEAGGVTAKIGG